MTASFEEAVANATAFAASYACRGFARELNSISRECRLQFKRFAARSLSRQTLPRPEGNQATRCSPALGMSRAAVHRSPCTPRTLHPTGWDSAEAAIGGEVDRIGLGPLCPRGEVATVLPSQVRCDVAAGVVVVLEGQCKQVLWQMARVAGRA